MPMPQRAFILTALAVIMALSSTPTWADPAAAVEAFNRALTDRDQERAIRQLAPGGVQFTLRSMHEGASPDKLVAPITPHWSMIVPVIFASTLSYTREVEILDSESYGDLATVWTRTRTTSMRAGSDQATETDFTEMYMLIKTADGWKIAAIADNRQATGIN